MLCGINEHGFEAGCSKDLADPDDRYKCADCDVTFHRHCIRKHFVDSGDERQRHVLNLEDVNLSLRKRLLELSAVPGPTDPHG